MTYHFPKKILGSRIVLTYKRLIKSYNEFRKNLRKILRSFEHRARGVVASCFGGCSRSWTTVFLQWIFRWAL